MAELLTERLAGGEALHPSSPEQRALWLASRLAPGSPAYNLMRSVRIGGAAGGVGLRKALQGLVDRHPALRTTFLTIGSKLLQCIHETMPVAFQVEDASTWSTDELNRRFASEADRPFDLERGPLLRSCLFKRSAGEHVLLLVVHHIACDYWSLEVLLDDLRAIHSAERTSRDPALPPLPRCYADYAVWKNALLDGPRGDQLRAYWHQYLAGELPIMELPTDRPRPPVWSYRGESTKPIALDDELKRGLKELGQCRGATPYMVLLAALQVLLHRYSGQDEVLVGTPFGARSQPGFEGVVGHFINPLVMRAVFSPAPSFETLLSRTRQDVLRAIEHADYPFSWLVEQLRPARDASRSPLFQVGFAWDKSHLADAERSRRSWSFEGDPPVGVDQLALEPIGGDQRGALFDLTLTILEQGDEISLIWKYSTDLFDASTVSRLADHFLVLLGGIVARPSAPVCELPLLDEVERRTVTVEWNATVMPNRSEACIHELFEEQVRRHPVQGAVVEGDTELTYRELNARSNWWARRLRVLGVGPEVRVGLCAERSADLVVGMLAVLKAGGAFVPLDPTYPSERLEFMLADAGVAVMVTQRALAERLPQHRARMVELECGPVAAEDGTDLGCRTVPGNAAYVIYTSGSTGRPKGVVVEHRGLVNVAVAQRRVFGLTAGVRVLQFASLSFDASVFETVMALGSGGTLVLAPRQELIPGRPLTRLLQRQRIQLAVMPPSALAATPVDALPELTTLAVAGERCPQALSQRWRSGRRRFFNLYGPTEGTIWTTCAELPAAPAEPPSIGKPIANTRVYVVDRHLQPVPIGVAGELCIGGVGVSRGYLGRPGLTAERYVPDPFGPAGARLYRTGDRVRWRRGGELDFLGRLDDQVKLRGFRIELGEIEARLRADPRVADAAVVVRRDGRQDERLVGYVVPDGRAPQPEELRTVLRRSLPEYMVPLQFVVVAALPLTPNGKVDRKALPAPGTPTCGAGPLPGGLEARIAALWCRVLGVTEVGAADGFFDLGGHSLLLARMHEELEVTVGRPVPISDLFRFSTVAALASHLGSPAAPGAEAADDEAAARALRRRTAAARTRRRPHAESG